MIKKILEFLLIDNVLKKDVAFLKKITLFEGLSDRSLAKVSLIVFKKIYLAGEKIYETGAHANIIYIIKSGKVKLISQNFNKIIEHGNFFGELSLIANCRYNCNAIALKESELYFIYRTKFEDMVESNNKIGFAVMKNLAFMLAKNITISNCNKVHMK
ncbi:MAG: cyclic nucleotide-binding domain-containing protein [Endomicrobium sp.]|jgi:CRP-like cAMP-binding protein|nr:cyclic nucleotide-binding domain-containing protein [Endomicrobium sp.]